MLLPPSITVGRGLRRRLRLTTRASPRGVLSDSSSSVRRLRGRAEGGVDGTPRGRRGAAASGGERSGECHTLGAQLRDLSQQHQHQIVFISNAVR